MRRLSPCGSLKLTAGESFTCRTLAPRAPVGFKHLRAIALQEIASRSETRVHDRVRRTVMRDNRPRFSEVVCDKHQMLIGYEPGGRRFDSCRGHYPSKNRSIMLL